MDLTEMCYDDAQFDDTDSESFVSKGGCQLCIEPSGFITRMLVFILICAVMWNNLHGVLFDKPTKLELCI